MFSMTGFVLLDCWQMETGWKACIKDISIPALYTLEPGY
jgi:hypothetical protein